MSSGSKMKSLVSIDNKFIVLQLSYSDTKPRLWFYKDKSGNKSYMLIAIKILSDRKHKENWGIGITFFAFNLAFGFPLLMK